MADQTLDIVIRMLANGDGAKVTKEQLQEIEKLSTSTSGRQAENAKAVATAVKQLNPALTEQAQETKKVEDAVKAETRETDKATTSNKNWKEALKGVSLEIPGVAQALRLIASPVALIGAAASVGIGQIMSMMRAIDELAAHVRAFETRNTRIDPLSVIAEQTGSGRDGIKNQVATMNEVARGLAQMTMQLSIAQNLASQGAQVQLASDLEAIEAKLARGEITLAQAIQQRADAQSRARKESEAAMLDALAKQAAIEELAASRASHKSKTAAAAAEGMQPQIDAQIDITNKAQADVGDIAAVNELKRKNLDEQRSFFMDAVSAPQMAKLDFLRYAKIRADSGMTAPHAPRNPMASDADVRAWAEKGLAGADEGIEQLNIQSANAKKLAAKEERRLAQLKAQQAAKDAEAQTNAQTSDAAEQRGQDIRERHKLESKGAAERAPKIEATEKSRTQREVQAAEKAEAERIQRERDRQAKEVQGSFRGASVSAPADAGAVASALGGSNAPLQDLVSQILAAAESIKADNEQFKAEVAQRVSQLAGGQRSEFSSLG